MKRWDIQTLVLIAAVVPAFLVAVALASFFTFARLTDLDAELQTHGDAIARQMAPASEYGVFSGNTDALDHLAQIAVRDAGVDGVAVADKEGKVLARAGRIDEAVLGAMVPPPEFPVSISRYPGALVFMAPVGRLWRDDGDLYAIESAPGTPRQAAIGTVLVYVSLSPLETRKNELIVVAGLITLGGLLLAAFIAHRLSRGVVGPVLKLAHTVDRIRSGQLQTRASVDVGGSLKMLESGINAMAASLEADQRELERRIAAATLELQKQKELAEKANRTKTQFLAAASHDLRQPIQAVGLLVTALQLRAKDEDTRRLASRVERALGGLEAVVEGLLEISRLDAGVITPREELFPVGRIFTVLRDTFSAPAQEAALSLRFARTEAWCVSDPVLLERILSNLLSNALRYTARGGVLVGVRRHGANLRIEVCDTGSGIPDDKREHIFREFVQLNNAAHARDKGLGLGLAIVDRFCRLLGHRLSLRSVVGKGSVFSLVVPRGHRPKEDVVAEGNPAATDDLKGLRILVIDDDVEVLESLDAFLSQIGASVITASTASEARTAIPPGDRGVDVVLSDYRLPDGDGVAVIEDLRRSAGRSIPAIVITAEAVPASLQRIAEHGLILLHKPVSADALIGALMRLIGQPTGD
ncbi:MAG: ATP-binding protein [Rhodocyclaceae bacterium]